MNIGFNRQGQILFSNDKKNKIHEVVSVDQAEVIADKIINSIREAKKLNEGDDKKCIRNIYLLH